MYIDRAGQVVSFMIMLDFFKAEMSSGGFMVVLKPIDNSPSYDIDLIKPSGLVVCLPTLAK